MCEMDFMTLLSANAISDGIGKLIINSLYGWISTWTDSWGVFSAFSITVIMFSIFLKIVVLPIDVWQKNVGRKNAKKMEVMKPALEKITKQCGNNKELLMQKQRVLYKEHGYSTFGACLPMILTLVVFFVIFGGFNSAVRMYNERTYENLSVVYEEARSAEIALYERTETTVEGVKTVVFVRDGVNYTETQVVNEAIKKAEDAVVANYETERFLFTVNIFVADSWKNPIPSVDDFAGSGMGKSNITSANDGKYEIIMRPIMEKYNTRWNGYLMLPLIVFALNMISMKLNKPPEQPTVAGQTEEQKKAQQSQAKLMQFLMPIMMLVFALFYSAAFTLYMFINTAFTTLFNLGYNIVTKKIDAKEKDRILSTTVKK